MGPRSGPTHVSNALYTPEISPYREMSRILIYRLFSKNIERFYSTTIFFAKYFSLLVRSLGRPCKNTFNWFCLFLSTTLFSETLRGSNPPQYSFQKYSLLSTTLFRNMLRGWSFLYILHNNYYLQKYSVSSRSKTLQKIHSTDSFSSQPLYLAKVLRGSILP